MGGLAEINARAIAPHRAPRVQGPDHLHFEVSPWPATLPALSRDTWDALAASTDELNPFYERWFCEASLRALDAQTQVEIATLWSGQHLLGLMPLVRMGHYDGKPIPHLANWVHANCFVGAPLVCAGAEAQFWHHLLNALDRAPWLAAFFHLYQMPLDGPLSAALEDVCSDQGRACRIVLDEKRAVLRSDLTPEAYLRETLSKNRQREWRRQFNKLSQLGEACFEWHEDNSDIEPWIANFLRLEASGWKGASGSALTSCEKTRALLSNALQAGAAQGRLIRLSLKLDGQPIAMLVNFVSRPGSFGFKTAFDENYARFSPGVLLEREYLQTLARDDIDWCDSCAAADHPVMNMLWSERRRVGRVSVAIGGTARRMLGHTLIGIEHARGRP